MLAALPLPCVRAAKHLLLGVDATTPAQLSQYLSQTICLTSAREAAVLSLQLSKSVLAHDTLLNLQQMAPRSALPSA